MVESYLKNKPEHQGSRALASRIKLYKSSLGYQTLEFAGARKWASWRTQREMLAEGNLEEDQKELLDKANYFLRQMLKNAEIVVCTIFTAGQGLIRQTSNPRPFSLTRQQ